MKLRALFHLIVLLQLTAINAFAFDTNLDTTLPLNCTVTFCHVKEISLKHPAAQMLYSNALILLKSSNFNSSKFSTREWTGPETEIDTIHEVYRQAIASGKYLIVSFKKPLKMETVGGVVIANEIFVSLNARDRIGLFTIDDEGRLISHAMFSGTRFQKLIGLAEDIAKNADNENRIRFAPLA